MSQEIKASDIELFDKKGEGRENNDKYNKIRELILPLLLTDIYKLDPLYGKKWEHHQSELNIVLRKISPCGDEYDSIELQKKGGLNNNFDYSVIYHVEEYKFIIPKLEFKFNAFSIQKTPQWLSMYYKDNFNIINTDCGYPSYFYDNYVPQLCEIYNFNIDMITKDDYFKNLYKSSSNHPFFIMLYKADSDPTMKKQTDKKTNLVHESIDKFLTMNLSNVICKPMTDKFQQSNKHKNFILWDCKTQKFNLDMFIPDELTVTSVVGIKNKNCIIVQTKCPTTRHKLLLRWKNHNGVLGPAWQISTERSAK